MTEEDIKRFWSKVDRRGDNECWPWLGARYYYGYGVFRADGKNLRSNRVAWQLAHGSLQGRHQFVCHRCDNPVCCNPAHLFVGTAQDNNDDMRSKGRARYTGPKNPPKGEAHWKRRLTEDQVREIRRIGRREKQRDLAVKFNVSNQTISAVLRREIWTGVEP